MFEVYPLSQAANDTAGGMSPYTLDEAKQAWGSAYEGLSQEEVNRRVRGFATLVRGIAHSGAISPGEFADSLGLEPAEANELLSAFVAVGMELDGDGNIAGAALTTTKTPHAMRFDGHNLYAWCALDTLFIPGLLEVTAEVESVCPVSGGEIHLTVSETGVLSQSHPDAVISVVLPGVSPRVQTGPASPT